MSKLPTAQEIIAEFRRRLILTAFVSLLFGFSLLGSVIVLAAGSPVLGLPAWLVSILLFIASVASMLWAGDLLQCPSCGSWPSRNRYDIYPARCKSCGVRLR